MAQAVEPNDNPVHVAIIGTQSDQGGGVANTKDGVIAVTPAGQSNLIVSVITPFIALVIRFANIFLTTFTGLLGAKGVGDIVGMTPEFMASIDFRTLCVMAAWSGFAAGAMATGKNLITILGRLEGKYPLLTGSI